MRGSPAGPVAPASPERSIPAGAGEPPRQRTCRCMSRVYPRGCGGARYHHADPWTQHGLSPRVRGSPPATPCKPRGPGSIPAGAGEPRRRSIQRHRREVYPRGCGGAVIVRTSECCGEGLSPRVRGSPGGSREDSRGVWSIPAGAGEPYAPRCCYGNAAVYPRGCGGAAPAGGEKLGAWGLSPRVRGSPSVELDADEIIGSIPAGAGEPIG